jgi:glycosyltransferase involved in cell wall biosynthesis
VANSRNVQKRVWRAYRRESVVVHPPVSVRSFYYRPPFDYYLLVSELVAYKRIMDAVVCFSRSGRPLRIVGDGPEFPALRKAASSNIEFCGRIPDSELREQYARCRAVVQPGEEDFGIVSVEALASGKPMVGLGRGGLVEIAPDEESGGFLYQAPGPESLETTVKRFESREAQIRPTSLQFLATRFSEDLFGEKILAAVNSPSTYPDPDVEDRPDHALKMSRSA